MDPNAALAGVMDAITALGEPDLDPAERPRLLDEIAEQSEALAQWLRKGGFAPEWERLRRR